VTYNSYLQALGYRGPPVNLIFGPLHDRFPVFFKEYIAKRHTYVYLLGYLFIISPESGWMSEWMNGWMVGGWIDG
jgi:hypothetical protein